MSCISCGLCPGVWALALFPPRVLSARPPFRDEKRPWFPMLYLCHSYWYALWCFRSNSALVSLAIAPSCSDSTETQSSWGTALRHWGGQRVLWEEVMNTSLKQAKVLFPLCLIGVSQDVSDSPLASCSKHRQGARNRFGWASGGSGVWWSCRSPHEDPDYRYIADPAVWYVNAPVGLQPWLLSGSSDNPHPRFLKERCWHHISNLVGIHMVS